MTVDSVRLSWQPPQKRDSPALPENHTGSFWIDTPNLSTTCTWIGMLAGTSAAHEPSVGDASLAEQGVALGHRRAEVHRHVALLGREALHDADGPGVAALVGQVGVDARAGNTSIEPISVAWSEKPFEPTGAMTGGAVRGRSALGKMSHFGRR
jgi:hypothetical protein